MGALRALLRAYRALLAYNGYRPVKALKKLLWFLLSLEWFAEGLLADPWFIYPRFRLRISKPDAVGQVFLGWLEMWIRRTLLPQQKTI